jgi:Ca2+-transporting ATPase
MMTMVVRGRGLGVVVRTGIKTEVGKSSKLLEQGSALKKTDLQRKLSVLGKYAHHHAIMFFRILFFFNH